MAATVVIRFGALGDLCVTAWFLAGLAENEPHRPTTLVTKRVFAPLADEVPGVDVLPLEPGGPGALLPLARALRSRSDARILDAHGVIRSRLLAALAGRRVDARLAKDTAARRSLVALARRELPLDRDTGPHLLDRLDALVDGAPGRGRLSEIVRPPWAHLGGERRTGLIGLAPGAKWPSKRWPDYEFCDLAKMLLELPWVELRLFLGPEEEAWFAASPLASLASPRLEIVRETDLTVVARRLGECRRLIVNDSGLLHLAEAVGTPVIALFGPTVRAFGYAPLLPDSRLLEIDLACRPCSRTGSAACRRGDLACLTRIPSETVRDALIESLARDAAPGETP